MSVITFDKLAYLETLKASGIPEAQARAHAMALDDALRDTVSTKEDIRLVRHEIESVRQELLQEISSLRQEVRQEISGVRQELRQEISSVRHDMELLKRDLTIRLGGMIMALGGVLIAVKYLG